MREIARLAADARASKLSAADYAGSTFTINNNGSYGTWMTAPTTNALIVANAIDRCGRRTAVVLHNGDALASGAGCISACHGTTAHSTVLTAGTMARLKRELEERDWTTQL